MTAQFIRSPVDEFPVRLVGHANVGVARVGALAVHEEGDEDATSVPGQAAGDLGGFGYTGMQTRKLLG